MHSAQLLSVLALVGSALAAPHRKHGNQGNFVIETLVRTAYVTQVIGGTQPTPTPISEAVVTAAPEPAPVTTTSAPVVVVDTPSSTAVVPATETASTSSGYMAIVDEYRVKLGLAKLAHSADREATALKTAQDGNGEMVHQLLPGTYGQVLAPGGPEDFKHVFVGGWLCERPDLPGLDGECATESKGWMYTSTGHADILVSDSYKNIGCSNAGGIWACDLGW